MTKHYNDDGKLLYEDYYLAGAHVYRDGAGKIAYRETPTGDGEELFREGKTERLFYRLLGDDQLD